MSYVKSDPVEKITNLAKKNYGFSREYNRLTIRPTDKLDSVLSKLRKYFYKNLDAEEKATTGHSLKEDDYVCSYEKEAVRVFFKFAFGTDFNLGLRKNYGEGYDIKFPEVKNPTEFGKEYAEKELEALGVTGFNDGQAGIKRAVKHAYYASFECGDVVLFIDPANNVKSSFANRACRSVFWRSSHCDWVTFPNTRVGKTDNAINADSGSTAFSFANLADVLGFYKLYKSVAAMASERYAEAKEKGLNEKFVHDPGTYARSSAIDPEMIYVILQLSLCNSLKNSLYNDSSIYEEVPEALIAHKLEGEEQEMYAAVFGSKYATGDYWLIACDLTKFPEGKVPKVYVIDEFNSQYGYANEDVCSYRLLLFELWRLKTRLFFEDYVQTIASVSTQLQALKKENASSHAKTYETKKNINKETQKRMKELDQKWEGCFSSVEIDNGVDLNELGKVEDDMSEILKILPRVDNNLPIMRFRKIHQHKAYGIFFPHNNTLAVDYRDGLQSFIHEYGHYLDYNWNENEVLSLERDFKRILVSATDRIDRAYRAKKAGLPKGKIDYYKTPTEVFARAFEIYCSRRGLDTTFIKNPERYAKDETMVVYDCFKDCLDMIDAYFDRLFPELADSIHELTESKRQKAAEIEKKKTVPEPEQAKVMSSYYSASDIAQIMANAEKVGENAYQLSLF